VELPRFNAEEKARLIERKRKLVDVLKDFEEYESDLSVLSVFSAPSNPSVLSAPISNENFEECVVEFEVLERRFKTDFSLDLEDQVKYKLLEEALYSPQRMSNNPAG
jgi:hypothetical protein